MRKNFFCFTCTTSTEHKADTENLITYKHYKGNRKRIDAYFVCPKCGKKLLHEVLGEEELDAKDRKQPWYRWWLRRKNEKGNS